jgi:hypothetical protein
MKSSPRQYYGGSREMMAAPRMSPLAPALTLGEPRVFEPLHMGTELPIGTTFTTLGIGDLKVANVIFLFDITKEGKQFPLLTPIIKGNVRFETPAGGFEFYDQDTMLLGSGDLKDLAAKEWTYLSIANSRKVQAHVVEELTTTSEGAIITRHYKTTVTVDNPSPEQITVGYLLPVNGRVFSDLNPKPFESIDQGKVWLTDVNETEEFVLTYTETIERE